MGYFNRLMNKSLFGLIAFLSISSLFAQPFRFTNKIFQNVSVIENVVYANAPQLNAGLFLSYNNESSTTNIDLKMDIHQPVGDTSTNRPAIIFVHGGAFLLGNKNHDDMKAFCDTFALRGYVTATIEYRLGMNILDDASTTRAVYRGLQDGRAAVRFLRANASIYGIDPTRIYMAGSSAGAFIALQDVYMNEASEKPIEAGSYQFNDPLDFFPPYTQITAPDLGAFDIGENLDQNGKPDAIISLWGAIKHPDLITANDTCPVLLVHGTADATVPFGIGYPFNFPIFPATYGSFEVNKKLDALSFADKETYFVSGEGHEFYGVFNGNWTNGIGGNPYWDTIVNKAINFFYFQHKPEASLTFVENYLEVSFTNTSSDSKSWIWDFGDSNKSNAENPIHTYNSPGTYNVKLYIENEIKSWDTVSYFVTVSAPPIFTLSFYVTDGSNPISGANILINNQHLISDSNGRASLDLENGTYAYAVSAIGFYDVADTLLVNGSDRNLTINMTEIPEPAYVITFRISDGNNPISGANIEINNQVLITNEEGYASINLINGNYPFTVLTENYDPKSDTLIVNGEAQTVDIFLSISTAIYKLLDEGLKIYPNPANHMVQVKLPDNNQYYDLKIVDLTGSIMIHKTDVIHTIKLDISNYPSGIYFIFLQSKTHKTTRKLIIR